MHRLALALSLSPLGCGLGVLDELQDVPVCDSQATDPQCPGLHPGSTSSGDVIPTTSGADEGILTSTAATLSEPTSSTSTGESTGSTSEGPPAPAPVIVDVSLDPDTLAKAAAIAVQVQTQNAVTVTMALDGAEPVPLTKSGDLFTGAIEVYGSSMNGEHAVMIEASNAGLIDTQSALFNVDAPPAGQNIWQKTNDVPGSQTRAIAVDGKSNVYDVGTLGQGVDARMGVSKHDADGKLAWPGTWLTFNDAKSRGEDIAVGPDGMIYVLGNFEDDLQHTRWWLFKLDPGAGVKIDEEFGELDEPARGLSIADNGDLAIVGYVTVAGKQKVEDIQTKIWFRPTTGDGVSPTWGYLSGDNKSELDEVPEDILITDDRIFVVGSAEGYHPDTPDNVSRKRLFLIELNFKGQVVREYVAGNAPARSGGYALAVDGKGGVVSVGWKCEDLCTQKGDIRWFSGDGDLEPYQYQTELGQNGPAYALDVAYSPAGYNLVASAAMMGTGSLGLHITGRRADKADLVLDYSFDTPGIEMGQAVAVGPHGYIWFGGLRILNNAFRAVIGRAHG